MSREVNARAVSWCVKHICVVAEGVGEQFEGGGGGCLFASHLSAKMLLKIQVYRIPQRKRDASLERGVPG